MDWNVRKERPSHTRIFYEYFEVTPLAIIARNIIRSVPIMNEGKSQKMES